MSEASEDARALLLVRLAYGLTPGDDRNEDRALNFRVAPRTIAGAIACVHEIGKYNGFDGQAVGEALREINDALDAGGYWRFSVGREGSPVVYIDGLDADEQKRAAEILYRVGANEIGADERGELRAWWD